jgi:glycine oxidase
MKVIIVGAGIAGKLCALNLNRLGHDVTVFDRHDRYSEGATSFVAAGLLTPLAEAANGDPDIAILGKIGLRLWEDIASEFNDKDLVDLSGSVSLAFKSDLDEFRDFERRLVAKGIKVETKNEAIIEPDLDQEHLTYHLIPGEGKVDTISFMKNLQTILETSGVSFAFSQHVDEIGQGWVKANGIHIDSDLVIDCRGVAAQKDIPELRGVRGEVVHLRAPEVNIKKPVRVLHPRHPIYIVPRKNHEYVIGATSIESEYDGPISVKSMLDLLNGVYNIHHGFRYADIIKTQAGLRPALFNNLPLIEVSHKLLRVNGLFRHGYLLGPLFAESVSLIVQKKSTLPELKPFIREIT